MPSLNNRKILRIYAKHSPYTDGHLGEVKSDMDRLGPPEINVVEFRGDYFAVEGSHRLAVAHHLGLTPRLLVSHPDHVDPADEEFWERVKATLPHYSWVV